MVGSPLGLVAGADYLPNCPLPASQAASVHIPVGAAFFGLTPNAQFSCGARRECEIASDAGKGAWAGMSAEKRSAELKRLAAKRGRIAVITFSAGTAAPARSEEFGQRSGSTIPAMVSSKRSCIGRWRHCSSSICFEFVRSASNI
jgi:hypothetical protein